jgi:hypothetical protein
MLLTIILTKLVGGKHPCRKTLLTAEQVNQLLNNGECTVTGTLSTATVIKGHENVLIKINGKIEVYPLSILEC